MALIFRKALWCREVWYIILSEIIGYFFGFSFLSFEQEECYFLKISYGFGEIFIATFKRYLIPEREVFQNSGTDKNHVFILLLLYLG